VTGSASAFRIDGSRVRGPPLFSVAVVRGKPSWPPRNTLTGCHACLLPATRACTGGLAVTRRQNEGPGRASARASPACRHTYCWARAAAWESGSLAGTDRDCRLLLRQLACVGVLGAKPPSRCPLSSPRDAAGRRHVQVRVTDCLLAGEWYHPSSPTPAHEPIP